MLRAFFIVLVIQHRSQGIHEFALRPGIAFERVDATVNDPAFADVVADRYLSITKEHAHV